MATNLAQSDNNGVIQIVAGATHTAGTPIKTGTALFGVPQASVSSGAQSALAVGGCHDLPKTAAVESFAVGARVYWNGTVVNSTASGDFIGICSKAALIGDATVEVRINGEVGAILDAGALSADVAGRAVMSDGYFDAATALLKFAVGSIHPNKRRLMAVTSVADASVIMTAAQMLDGIFIKAATGAGQTLTTATAVQIVAALDNTATTGASFDFSVTCIAGANPTTLTAGVGVTLAGPPGDFVLQVSSRGFRCFITAPTTVSIVAL